MCEAQDTAVAFPAVRATENQWFRHVFQVAAASDSETRLTVSTNAAVSVYLNGQRLIKNRVTNQKAFEWKTGALLRKGANCLAVAIAAPKQKNVLRASLRGHGVQAKVAAWKATTSTPPVGWQQTDFNDRDWKPAEIAQVSADPNAEDPVLLTWNERDSQSRSSNDGFEFLDGDHVVLLGATFIERAQQFGHLECALNAAFHDRRITFRNLGWSADTVFAESRGIFDSPAKGYARMIEHIRAEEPDVILVCYGQNEAMSFAPGQAGLNRFTDQLQVLHSDLATTGADIVYLSPHPLVAMRTPLPDARRWNDRIEEFAAAIRRFADTADVPFIDLYTNFVADLQKLQNASTGQGPIPVDLNDHAELAAARNSTWTDNGMHWNDNGYQYAGQVVASRLFKSPATLPQVTIDFSGRRVTAVSGTVQNITWSKDGTQQLQFRFQPAIVGVNPVTVRIPSDAASDVTVSTADGGHGDSVPFAPCRACGQSEDSYVLYVCTNSSAYERLRTLTVQKNELYFHRWRPQNITYLFGFRKHEQGNNAREIAQFDPLIDEIEQKIMKARQPTWQTITVSRSR